ncbi:MAG: PaaI family thioesterase [Rhodobacteraceae bacterium]|nr:PaaI family thioesterase [Paracoccaceae bacterium]
MKFVATLSALTSPSELSALSGLEFMRGMLEGRLPAPPICKTLGYALESIELGRACFIGQPSFDVLNPFGSVHGGWFGTLIDSCMASAVQSHLTAGQSCMTLEFKVNILRGLTPDSGPVRAIGTTVHVGRKTGIAEGRIIGVADGKTYATGSTTCIIFADPGPDKEQPK